MGPRHRRPDRLPRRLRPRRGSRAGGVRSRGRTMAPRRDSRQPARMAGDDGAEPCDRSDPPRSHAPGQDTPTRGAGIDGGRDGRDDDPGRAPRARLHVLPSGARSGCPGRADAADAGRADGRGDRPRLPRPRAHHGQAARPREDQDQGRRDPVSRAAGAPAPRPARRGARRRLSDLQRGLRRPRRPRGRSDPAGTLARRVDARRAGSAWTAGADAGERRPARGAVRRRRGRPPPRPGSIALG